MILTWSTICNTSRQQHWRNWMHPDTFRACNCKLKCTWVQHRSVPTTPLKLSLNRFYRFHTMAPRMPNTPDTLVQRCLLALPRLMLQRQKNKINFIPTFSIGKITYQHTVATSNSPGRQQYTPSLHWSSRPWPISIRVCRAFDLTHRHQVCCQQFDKLHWMHRINCNRWSSIGTSHAQISNWLRLIPLQIESENHEWKIGNHH